MAKEEPSTQLDIALSDLAHWIDDNAARTTDDPVAFAEFMEDWVGSYYTKEELVNILLTWVYDYALVKAEEADGKEA